MKINDYIFSNRPRQRIVRHSIFWLLWWVYFMTTYYFPHYLFPGWNLQSLGIQHGLSKIIFGAILNSFSLLANQILLTYAILYFLLPVYFLKGQYLAFAFGILGIVLISIPFVYYTYWWYNRPIMQIFFGRAAPVSDRYIYNCIFSFILFNFPTISGFAVTIKLLKRWWLKQQETEQVDREKTNAELQLLKARIHPHFLFNSLNNIYSFALETSPKTPTMIQKLSDLLHYMLYDCNQPKVPLEKELKMIQDYIELEKIRYGSRLKLNISISEESLSSSTMIVPLLLIPFIENSFKHGTSRMIGHPKVSLDLSVTDDVLYFRLMNNKPIGNEELSVNGNHGLGLKNVKKRLALLYPGRYELEIVEESSTYTVWLKINLTEVSRHKVETTERKIMENYELA